MRIREVFILLGGILFVSCSPSTRCPEIKFCEGTGDKIKISMIECRSSDVVFDLELKLSLIKENKNSLSTKEFVHIDTKDIKFKKNKNFDYDVIVSRMHDKMFFVNIAMSEGNKVGLQGTNLSKSIAKSYSRTRAVKGKLITFRFEGVVKKNDKGTLQVRIESEEMNRNRLKSFNENLAKFNESYSFDLLLN